MKAHPPRLQKRAVQRKRISKTAKNVISMPYHTKSVHVLFW